MIAETGKQLNIKVLDREITLFNQHSSDWSHVYNHPVDPFDTLKTAGCGIFSVCHAVEWLTGQVINPNELADFSMENGGRMYDGTDRPALLRAMQRSGLAAKYGFIYSCVEHENGADALYGLIASGGVALCNLRVGHIVCIVAARIQNGVKQLLALDSHPTNRPSAQYDSILEVVDGSFITYATRNSSGVFTGYSSQAAAFWVDARAPFDYDRLNPTRKKQ